MNTVIPAALGAPATVTHVPPLIAARAVEKTYVAGEQIVRALGGVSFEIRQGEFVAITGPSGSGKSTIMNLIGALDTPSAGSLLVDGRDIGALSSDALAELRNRVMGFVFQQFHLLSRTTALRQVMLPLAYAKPRRANPEEAARMRLRQVGLGDRCGHHPRQLSGGEQQRVAIARALVNEPKLLLADEPTGALDSKTSEGIMRLFGELNEQGTTVVVVTHEADVARHAQRQILFRDGKVIQDMRASVGTLRRAPTLREVHA